MPIYEYQCNSCGYQFEKMQKISDGPCRLCPQCQAEDVQKMVSSPSFRLKGTGWYVTDFRDKQKTSDKKASDGQGGASDSTTTD